MTTPESPQNPNPPDPNWAPPVELGSSSPAPTEPSLVSKVTAALWTNRGIKGRVGVIVGALFIAMAIGGVGGAKDDSTEIVAEATTTTEKVTTTAEATTTTEKVTTTAEATTTTEKVTTTAEPELTGPQRNAIRSAKDYLSFTAFSRLGLIGQLEFEDYSTEVATFAVDSLDVDYNEQAAKSAQEYLDFTSFSCKGLIGQLEFEDYTKEQATYGAGTTDACE